LGGIHLENVRGNCIRCPYSKKRGSFLAIKGTHVFKTFTILPTRFPEKQFYLPLTKLKKIFLKIRYNVWRFK
jgi:hypothetical protein